MEDSCLSFRSFLSQKWVRETGKTVRELESKIQTGKISAWYLDSAYEEWLDYREQYLLEEIARSLRYF